MGVIDHVTYLAYIPTYSFAITCIYQVNSKSNLRAAHSKYQTKQHDEAIRQIIPLVRPTRLLADPNRSPFKKSRISATIIQPFTNLLTLIPPSEHTTRLIPDHLPPSFLGVEPSKPTTTDSVFVIIDAQNEYDHGLLAISDVKSSRAVIGNVLKKYRDAKGDVVCLICLIWLDIYEDIPCLSLFSPAPTPYPPPSPFRI